MAIERNWAGVPAQLLTSNGGIYGQVSVPSTVGIKVKQKVKVGSNTQETRDLEVKRVLNETDLLLGPIGPSMTGPDSYVDLTLFLTATNAYLLVPEGPRNAIIPDAFWRAVYEEEPTVAIRTFSVDHLGRRYTEANPLPVQLSNGSIDIGTVNAQLEMFITHRDNDPDNGDVHSSLRIGDGTDVLAINPDGSLNVVVQTSGSDTVISTYNEANSVSSGANTTIVTFTAGIGVNSFLSKIDYSGDNIAKFTVEINGSVIDKQRTYFGSSLNGTFNFAESSKGLRILPGDVVTLKVIHSRLSSGDFNGRIQVVES